MAVSSPATFRPLPAAAGIRQPWANGRGATLELGRQTDARGLVWRLSRAQVTEDGPFSDLPGLTRILVLLDGPGFDLVWTSQADTPPRRHRLQPLEPVSFPGSPAPAAAGVLAPSADLNLMVRSDLPPPSARLALPGPVISPPAGLTILYALQDSRVADHDLTGGDALVVAGQAAIRSGRCLAFDLPLAAPPPAP